MKPINLSDDELEAVMHAARPLPVRDRYCFLQAVAEALRAEAGPLGPGVIHRILVQIQREFWDPPNLDRSGKYR